MISGNFGVSNTWSSMISVIFPAQPECVLYLMSNWFVSKGKLFLSGVISRDVTGLDLIFTVCNVLTKLS